MKIELKSITKYYDKKILDNINLSINNVNSVGIIGKSGCGKSTLLRQLAAMEYVDDGTIYINDTKIDKNSKQKHQNKIGYVFQKHNLFPHLSLKHNIMLILTKVKKLEVDEAEKIAVNMLKKMHLSDQMDKKPSKVSGGQAQRASIARALSTEPELLFLDEPTAALDPLLTREVLNAISELKNIGKNFIFVTHEISFLRNFADYIIFMDEGKIVEHGTIECLNNPKTEQLKKFLMKV